MGEGEEYRPEEDETGLTEGHRKQLLALRERLTDGKLDEVELSEEESSWASNQCLCRYLRARGWDLNKAAGALKDTIEWRRSYGPQLSSERMNRRLLDREAASLKMYVTGHDRAGRPIVVMRPARDNTGDEDAEWKVRYLVWVVERCVQMMDTRRGVEKMVWLIEMSGMKVAMTHSMSITKNCINIMQSHYVERLGKAFFINAPWLFSALWKVIAPFLDPVTKAKVSFIKSNRAGIEELHHMIDPSQLEEDLQGTFRFNFNLEHWLETSSYDHSDAPPPSPSPSS